MCKSTKGNIFAGTVRWRFRVFLRIRFFEFVCFLPGRVCTEVSSLDIVGLCIILVKYKQPGSFIFDKIFQRYTKNEKRLGGKYRAVAVDRHIRLHL